MIVFEAEYISLVTTEYRVRVHAAVYSGSTTVLKISASGFTLRYDSGERSLLAPVVASQCSIPFIIEPHNDAAAEIFISQVSTSSEENFWVTVERRVNSTSPWTLFWFGTLLPDFYVIEDLGVAYQLVLRATDDLGRLKGFKYINNNYPYGLLRLTEHITNCLNASGLPAKIFNSSDVFLRTIINWTDANIGYSTTKCPLHYSFANGVIFTEKKSSSKPEGLFEPKSCYDVLSDILRHFAARIYLSNGSYYIEQIAERASGSFAERRFSRTGAFLNASTVSYDLNVSGQTLFSGARLSGGTFGFIPAAKRARAIYAHEGNENFLVQGSDYWYRFSPYLSTPISISNVILDGCILKFKFRFLANGEITVFNNPWRMRFKITVVVGSRSLYGTSQNLVINGAPTTTILPTVGSWEPGTSNFFVVSTAFCHSETLEEEFDVVFDTPKITHVAGPTFINVSVDFYDAVDIFQNSPTFTSSPGFYWHVQKADLRIAPSPVQNAASDGQMVYEVENPSSGNSLEIEQDFYFGHKVVNWSEATLFTNTPTTPTGATWGVGGPGSLEFNQLWAREAMALYRNPTPVYNGSIIKAGIFFHNRIVFTGNTAWLFLNGEFFSNTGYWACELARAGVARTGIVANDPYPWPGPSGDLPTTEFSKPGGHWPTTAGLAFDGPAGLAITALTVNYINNTINPGTVTSLPLRYQVKSLDYVAGDDILVIVPTAGLIFDFEVSATSADGDSSLSVTAKTINKKIPKGSLLLYGPLNKYTKQGGAHASVPPGTAPGQILRWNNSSKRWEVYSGAAAGHVLTWSSTNGWESAAPSASGVTGTGLANYVAVWLSSSQIGYYPPFYYDPTNQRLGVGTQAPAARIHAFFGSVSGTVTGLMTNATATGALVSLVENSGATTSSHAVQELRISSGTGGNPFLLLNITNSTFWTIGADRVNHGRFRIVNAAGISGSGGVTIAQGTNALVGINTTTPTQHLDVAAGARAKQFIITNHPPTISARPGMGTSPTNITAVGGINGFYLSFTTGTAPSANADIFQATYNTPFPSFSIITFSAYNAITASQITRFFVGSAGNTSFVLRANGALDPNTTYALSFIIMGY